MNMSRIRQAAGGMVGAPVMPGGFPIVSPVLPQINPNLNPNFPIGNPNQPPGPQPPAPPPLSPPLQQQPQQFYRNLPVERTYEDGYRRGCAAANRMYQRMRDEFAAAQMEGGFAISAINLFTCNAFEEGPPYQKGFCAGYNACLKQRVDPTVIDRYGTRSNIGLGTIVEPIR